VALFFCVSDHPKQKKHWKCLGIFLLVKYFLRKHLDHVGSRIDKIDITDIIVILVIYKIIKIDIIMVILMEPNLVLTT
jgi:hypothetical protein